jgi:hypothetical protein
MKKKKEEENKYEDKNDLIKSAISKKRSKLNEK